MSWIKCPSSARPLSYTHTWIYKYICRGLVPSPIRSSQGGSGNLYGHLWTELQRAGACCARGPVQGGWAQLTWQADAFPVPCCPWHQPSPVAPLPSGAAPWAVPWPQEQQRLCDTTETEFPAGHELPGSACARLAGTALYQGWSAQTLEL